MRPHPNAAAEDDVEFSRWLAAQRQAAPEPRPARRDAVVQAPGLQAPGDASRTARTRGRPGRPFFLRRSPRDARPEPAAALGALRPTCPNLWREGARPWAWPAQHRPADRHDRLPRRRLLRRWPTPARMPRCQAIWPATRTWTSWKTWARSTCTSAAASTAAATTTAATSASWASTRTARSGTRSRWAAPTARPVGEAVPGKVVGPSFRADEVPDVIEAVIDTYRCATAPAGPRPSLQHRQARRASSRSRPPPTRCAWPQPAPVTI
jgi:sulfite reductase (NADPH) hemoprotein beta-component